MSFMYFIDRLLRFKYIQDMSDTLSLHIESIKTQSVRVTEALYRVTDLFEQEEPLRWFLRRQAMEILDAIMKDNERVSFSRRIKNIDDISDRIARLVQHLVIAKVQSFMSHFNFEVLKKEYQNVGEAIRVYRQMILGTENAPPSVESDSGSSALEDTMTEESNGSAQKDSHILLEASSPYDVHLGQKKEQKKIRRNSGLPGSERKKLIQTHLQEKGWLSVTDITKALGRSVSEKTIQRDLLDLVRHQIVQKEGEKRWTRYSLARQ